MDDTPLRSEQPPATMDILYEKALTEEQDSVAPEPLAPIVMTSALNGEVEGAEGKLAVDELAPTDDSEAPNTVNFFDSSSELDDAELNTEPSDAEVDIDLDDKLVDFLEILQSSVDSDIKVTSDSPEYVHAPPELSQTVINCLISEGPMMFIAKYLVPDERPMPLPLLYAALGFSLPKSVFESPEYTSKHLEIGLQVAMRYVMKTRPRLSHPRTLNEVVSVIERSQNILIVTGAGISTSLGIPDFRSDNGLYAQLEHLGLADPQEVFDIRLFKEDPSIFFSVAAKILPEEGLHQGTPTHEFIRMLDRRGKLLRNYTQNIDNIEQFVGIPPEKLVQCHGSFGSAHCFTCGYVEPNGDALVPAILEGEIPRCPQCTERQSLGKRRKPQQKRPSAGDDSDEDETDDPSFGVMKPDITFFGESLPPRFDNLLFDEGDKDACDLVICLGTSLRVSPVSEIVKVVGRQVPQIYISKTPAKHLNFEASFLGGCDDTVELLAQQLGWDLTHPMAKRPANMPTTEYPGGHVEYDDGVYRFVDDNEPTDETIDRELTNQEAPPAKEEAAEKEPLESH